MSNGFSYDPWLGRKGVGALRSVVKKVVDVFFYWVDKDTWDDNNTWEEKN